MLRRRVQATLISPTYPKLAACTWCSARGGDWLHRHATASPPLHYSRRYMGMLAHAPLLLARGTAPREPVQWPLEATEENNPYAVSIDSVLQPAAAAGTPPPRTLRDLVRLLVDPAVEDVEDVSLVDFAAMQPKRQLRALGDKKAALEQLQSSEYYHAVRDARALRLAGVTSLGAWEAHPSRVPISDYAHGLLQAAYERIARRPRQSEREQVLAWLTTTIQKAVLAELTSADQARRKLLSPLLTDIRALPEAAVVQPSEPSAVKPEEAGAAAPAAAQPAADDENQEEGDEATATTGGRRRPAHTKRGKQTKKAGASHDEASEATNATQSSPAATAATTNAWHRKDDDAEIARLMMEAEAEFSSATAEGNDDAETAAADTVAAAEGAASAAKPRRGRAEPPKPPQEEDEAAAAAEAEEEHEGDEETARVLPPAVQAEPETAAPEAACRTAARADAGTTAAATLARLAELMLTQFNSADGYLHATPKELRADETRGLVVRVDEETAQVDPLALFSAFHAATVHASDAVAVRALKKLWAAYNAQQVAYEEASSDAAAAFYQQKSFEALVQGAMLLRAISREDPVTLDEEKLVPSNGFPLIASDTRGFGVRRPRSSPHTDMTAARVAEAAAAFKAFFAKKELRSTPLRPNISFNAGCSVVMLSGSTLHLYETSLKETVDEDAVRAPFAEAMLGVLHILREKIVSRVNTVHYHILVTALPATADDMDMAMTSPTKITSIDLSGPFTAAERTRLRALAEPLGMSEEVAEFSCVEEIVLAIEESVGASVVHDVLQGRDDLEALLTPTLLQLLPEPEDAEEAEEVPAAAAPPPPSRAAAANSTSRGAASAAAATAPAARREAARDHTTDDNKEDVEEEEELAAPAPAPPSKAAGRRTTKAAAPAAAASPPPPAIKGDENDDEELEEVEEIEEDDDDGADAPPPTAPPHAAAGKRSAATSRVAADDGDAEEEAEEGEESEEGEEAEEAEEEEVEEGEEDEADEEEAPPPPPPQPQPQARVRGKRSVASPSRQAPPPKQREVAVEEYEDEPEDQEEVAAPPIARAPAGRRAMPSRQPTPPVSSEQARAATTSSSEPAGEQWFKKRSKRRYFS